MANAAVHAVLAGELGLQRRADLLDHTALLEACAPLLASSQGWARTPWGRTLPRSCVGASISDYRASLQQRPQRGCAAVEALLLPRLAQWLEQLFALPLLPLHDADGTPLPAWALRSMNPGGGIAPHCEQVWNPLNLIETQALGPVVLEPAFQLSYLVILQAPSGGGELELFDHRGATPPAAAAPLRPIGQLPARPGEALLFNAGLHWHQVRPCHGPDNRVVLGGFVRLNADHSGLHAYV